MRASVLSVVVCVVAVLLCGAFSTVLLAQGFEPQPSVLTDNNLSVGGVTIHLHPILYSSDNVTGVIQLFAAINNFTTLAQITRDRVPETNLVASLGFSHDAWLNFARWSPMPVGFYPYPKAGYQGPTGFPRMAYTGGDLFIHAKATRQDVVWTLIDDFLTSLDGLVLEVTSINAWRNVISGQNRDLTGFVDGTLNCPPDQRVQQGLIGNEDPYHINGSFAIVQKWVHNMRAFRNMTLKQQQDAFGRTKVPSELVSPLPPTSHVARSQQSDFGFFILRQAIPFGTNTNGENGLLFLAYAKDSSHFDFLCKSMVGYSTYATPAGPTDGMFAFTTPVEGNYYFFPSLDELGYFGNYTPSAPATSTPTISPAPGNNGGGDGDEEEFTKGGVAGLVIGTFFGGVLCMIVIVAVIALTALSYIKARRVTMRRGIVVSESGAPYLPFKDTL